MKSQCFAQFGRRSAACSLMFPQQSLETKRCENIRERDSSHFSGLGLLYLTNIPRTQNQGYIGYHIPMVSLYINHILTYHHYIIIRS